MGDIQEFLRQAKLLHLLPSFTDQRVTRDALLFLDKDQLSMLTPYLGNQVLLWNAIVKEKSSSQPSAPPRSHDQSSVPSTSSQPTCSQPTPGSSGSGQSSRKRSGQPMKPPSTAASAKISKLSYLQFLENLDVSTVFLKDQAGKVILEVYQRAGHGGSSESEEGGDDEPFLLSRSQRRHVVHVLIQNILGNTENFDQKLLSVVAEKIVRVFPNECQATYYISPKAEGPQQVAPKGMLYFRLKNEKGKVRALGGRGSNHSASTRTRTPKSNGLCAILETDFNRIYPDLKDQAFLGWDNFIRTTVLVAKKDVKDPLGRELLREISSCGPENNRGKFCLVLALMASVRANHTSGAEKLTISTVRDSYLLHATTGKEIKAQIRARRVTFTSGSDGGGRPLIVVVGPKLSKVEAIYVSVAHLLYEVSCAITALDVCFKSFHAVHMEHPPECGHIWLLIQRALYNLTTEWDKEADLKHSWIKAYNC
ncbi:hypothetical protein ONE63_011143 [Megalurothrips usitatus]|uniref:Uncharacterized protein n=1 Tax=Megalurothrips usitatus TaxID=439358 RepID=A0AAV7XIM5_9NEOP|nr:hypothetical protein ONE63_011143 [Megalurothrips usitatus]